MKKINTALLSFGMSGWVFHAPFIDHHPGFELYAVWERSKKLAVDKYSRITSYDSLDELLNDPKIELVVVNTPNYTHYEYAKKSLLAGKHIVVEKPFTVTVSEGEELISLANEKNLVISVYQNRRYDSDFKTVKKILNKGVLGDVVEVEIQYMRYSELLSPKVHKVTPDRGTGALYDLGSHLIDQALFLFGKPDAVFADIRIVRQVSLVDDYFEVLLYYPKLRVRLRCSYLAREVAPGYMLHGSKGSFFKPKTNIQELDLQAGKTPDDINWGKEPESEKGLIHAEVNGEVIRENVESERGNYTDFYSSVFEAIRNGANPPVTGSEGLDVIRIIEKAIESNEKKCAIEL